MKIAIGNNRFDKKWKNREISWEEFLLKISSTVYTTETAEEYRRLKKGQQDESGLVSKAVKPESLTQKAVEELTKKIADLKEELFNLRFRLATGQLDNVMQITAVKRDIARAMTELTAKTKA